MFLFLVIRNLNTKLVTCKDGFKKLQAFIEAADLIRIKFNSTNVSNFKICLWNATSLNDKYIELSYFLNTNKVDIALIMETWLQSRTNLNFLNYDIIRRDSLRVRAGGLAIIINRSIKYHILQY